MKPWYIIDNIDDIDTPALVIYPDRVRENIRLLQTIVPDANLLRPHVKTNKSGEASSLMIASGISKFKCATIAEAEMLAQAGANDVLLAYQPVGPKALRLLQLQQKYPATNFSCLVDNEKTANDLSVRALQNAQTVSVFLDLNVGMNRTGIVPEKAFDLYQLCSTLKGIRVVGLHAYDGHIRDTDLTARTRHANECFASVDSLKKKIQAAHPVSLTVVAGGTPTFPIHAGRKNVECSPGTFIYWDMGYQRLLPDEPFIFAALVITRIISRPSADTLCVDLGHKSIAAENPLDSRVSFLNAPDIKPFGHSEEHMVFKVPDNQSYAVGDVFYGVPFHICPTCALYDSAWTINGNRASAKWGIPSRNRILTV